MKRPSGFTLIEVLVTVAIVAVLAAVGSFAYGRYVIKARVTEGLEFADAARLRVEVRLATGGGLERIDLLDKPVDMMTGLTWEPAAAPSTGTSTGNAPVGYILATMKIPGLGGDKKVNVLALQRLANGTWLCVSAAQVEKKDALNGLDALPESYLPATCQGAPMSAPKLASATPTTCSSGQDIVSLPTGPSCVPQCAAGQVRNSANPTQCQTNPATIATPVTPATPPTASTAPVTPATPPTASTAPVTPTAPPAKPTAPGGAPPEGTALRPGDAAKQDLQCHVCDPGMPEVCDQVTVQATCTYPNNFCVTIVDNNQDGTRSVTRRCGNFADDTYREWYQGTSDDDKCRERIDIEQQQVDFKCTFTCEKANCNQSGGSLRPPADALYQPM